MICVPITAKTSQEALSQIEQALPKAALVELRLDYLTDLNTEVLLKLLHTHNIPKIVTIRHQDEGGHYQGTEDQRLALYNFAIDNKAEYIDIEFSSQIRPQNLQETKLILSHHNFQQTPPLEDLQKLQQQIVQDNPHIIKIVTTANQPQDCQIIYQLLQSKPPDQNLIAIAMGDQGLYTRITGESLGSYLTFATIASKSASAPGQLTIHQLQEKRKNIALIGGRAVGKSHYAKQLSKQTGQLIIHLDDFIEELASTKIPTIIEQYGWPHFRDLEYQALKIVTEQYQGIIIDCGGGIVVEQDQQGNQTFSDRKAQLLKNTHVIHLTTTLKTQQQRLSKSHHRPALTANQNSQQELETITKMRTPWYAQIADETIEN